MRTLLKIILSTASFLALTLASDVSFAVSDCLYSGVTFSDGAVSCQSGHQFKCSDGTWQALDLDCGNPAPAPTVVNPADCSCTVDGVGNCDQTAEACCVSLEFGKCTKRCCPRQ